MLGWRGVVSALAPNLNETFWLADLFIAQGCPHCTPVDFPELSRALRQQLSDAGTAWKGKSVWFCRPTRCGLSHIENSTEFGAGEPTGWNWAPK